MLLNKPNFNSYKKKKVMKVLINGLKWLTPKYMF